MSYTWNENDILYQLSLNKKQNWPILIIVIMKCCPLVDKGNFPWKNRCWGQSFIAPSGFTLTILSLFYIPGSWSMRHLKALFLFASIWVKQGETFSSRLEGARRWACPCQATCLPQPKNPASVRQSSPHHTLSLRVPELSSLSSFLRSGTYAFLLITFYKVYMISLHLSHLHSGLLCENLLQPPQLKGGVLSYKKSIAGTKYNCLFFLPWVIWILQVCVQFY